eukprot:gb/GECG01006408.1/.p1 GENE.gb/GECG01006408.1/~~gb/GECG01006408.1/.p1  ORF type:complete len:718 (+),score=67.63 gb/GECG01006408.1/:1-2154(+)
MLPTVGKMATMPRLLPLLGAMLALMQWGEASLAVYPIPNDVPDVPDSASAIARAFRPPPGCICIDTEDIPCKKYDCRCACNLRAAACDANCCCDPDCSDEEVKRFTAAGTCLPEGPSNISLVRKCVDLEADPALAAVNPRFRMEIEDFNAFDAAFCVVVENNPVVGQFFTDPVPAGQTNLDSSTLDEASVKEANPFVRQYLESLADRDSFFIDQPSTYSVGTPVKAAQDTGSGLEPFRGGFFTLLGSSGSSSQCSFSRIATFRDDAFALRQLFDEPDYTAPHQSPTLGSTLLENVVYTNEPQLDTCYASITFSSSGCESLSTNRFIESLRIGRQPDANPSTPSDFLNVETGSIFVQDVDTGKAPEADNLPDTTFLDEGGMCSCRNVTSEIVYTLEHNGEGSLVGARADVSLTTIQGTCGSVQYIPVTTGITYVPEESIQQDLQNDATLENGNAIPRERSGNPGYQRSTPVLAGRRINAGTDDEAVEAFTQGLQMRGPDSGGLCKNSDFNSGSFVGVRFNEDLVFGCDVELTVSDLDSDCQSMPDAFGPVDSTTDRIGIFGNADPAAPFQWMPIAFPTAAPSTANFDDNTATCIDKASGISIEFLVAQVGEKDNPQFKIVSVRTSVLKDSWTHFNPSGTDTFQFKTVITWSVLPDEGLETFVPPHPQILPKLPEDLFFPFELAGENDGSAAPIEAKAVGMSALIAMCMMTVLFATRSS